MNKPHAHIYSAKINKCIAGTLKLPTYLWPRSPHGALSSAANNINPNHLTESLSGFTMVFTASKFSLIIRLSSSHATTLTQQKPLHILLCQLVFLTFSLVTFSAEK